MEIKLYEESGLLIIDSTVPSPVEDFVVITSPGFLFSKKWTLFAVFFH
ncbi:hypothetical protein [Mycoplasmopsis cynos]|nr:hypothetical protein [Mycoplasmopsis cynos]WQQ17673.1 hypothetical protein RRG56_03945 [Mycoplasmopsis cynos]